MPLTGEAKRIYNRNYWRKYYAKSNAEYLEKRRKADAERNVGGRRCISCNGILKHQVYKKELSTNHLCGYCNEYRVRKTK